MADAAAIASIISAAGTLVLAGATFAAVRSANTAARTAERSLMAGLRPLLIPSRTTDPPMKVLWSDSHFIRLDGGQAHAAIDSDVIYLALAIRNAGTGMAVLHAWQGSPADFDNQVRPDPNTFRRLSIDLFIPPGEPGFWESAYRDPAEPAFKEAADAIANRQALFIDVLYGDQEGGQRAITRFIAVPAGEENWYTQTGRTWNIDRPDPR
ncbi:MAG: hypothetical protein JO086_02465 [Acidimicrobiia bacterium]|nr:hypothetical protein [Acidimicrobiia bacterium]